MINGQETDDTGGQYLPVISIAKPQRSSEPEQSFGHTSGRTSGDTSGYTSGDGGAAPAHRSWLGQMLVYLRVEGRVYAAAMVGALLEGLAWLDGAASLESATHTVTAAAGAAAVWYFEAVTMVALLYGVFVFSMIVPMLWLLLPLTVRYKIGEMLGGMRGLVDSVLNMLQRRLCAALRSASGRQRR
jgi:hypothetical protein